MAPEHAARRPRSVGSSMSRNSVGVRPSSASSSRKSNIAKGDIGASPWQPHIEGGTHSSYSEIGGVQLQPLIGELASTRLVPAELPHPSDADQEACSVGMREILSTLKQTGQPHRRRLTFCPHMRSRGICRLPSCPFIHEAIRSRKEHTPLYGVNAPKTCKNVPCRFLKVLGCCPYAESCVYSHDPSLAGVSEIVFEADTNEDSSACTLGDQGNDVAALFMEFLTDGSHMKATQKGLDSTRRSQSSTRTPQSSMYGSSHGSRRRRTRSNVTARSGSRRRWSSDQSSSNS